MVAMLPLRHQPHVSPHLSCLFSRQLGMGMQSIRLQSLTFSAGIWRACVREKNFGETQTMLMTKRIQTNGDISRFPWRIEHLALLILWD
jgi:hypothetical protein